MQAFLLATDETPKLRPLTEHLPAPLVPIVDRPVMARVLELLVRHDFKRAWVSLYRMPGNIERYFGDGRRWGIRLEYVLQREAFGSAGSLKWAGASLKETLLVLPADVVLDLDIAGAMAFHRSHGGLVTAILARADGSAPPAWIREDGRVCGLDDEIAAGGSDRLDKYLLTGAYILQPQVLSLVPSRTRFDLAGDLLPQLLQDAGDGGSASLWGYVNGGYWNSLDTVAALRDAQRVYLHSAWAAKADLAGEPEPASDGPRVRYPSLTGLQLAPGIWVGHNPAIHPSVLVAPPVYVGDNCQVGREAELGPFTVIGANVIVDDEATVRDSLVFDNTYIGRLVNVTSRVVDRTLTIDVATGASTVIVDPFLLAETTPATVGAGLERLGNQAAAALLLVMLLPVIILVGLATLLSSLVAGQGLRVFARHTRIGHRPYTAAGDEAVAEPQEFDMVGLATRRADGGFTPLGHFLERVELDHLPALWNVLAGDLRLVGVQPLTEDEVNRSVEDWQHERLTYPAGFTGLWYIQAPRDADLDTTAVADAYYVATRTWRNDLRILGQTPAAWVRRIRTKTPDPVGSTLRTS
jgi:NDP-sugar pyrophosphorylase family protein